MVVMFSDFFACMCRGQHSLDSSSTEKKKQGFHQISCSNEKLKQTLKKLEEKELILKSRVSQETERAKGFIRSKNRPDASNCLRRKKYYEAQLEQLRRLQLLVRNQEQKLSNCYQKHEEQQLRKVYQF